MTDDALEFGARLSLAMKLLNISRGALASEARADKSLVSRWVRGLATPRGPYLATLTEIVAARAPGFSQLSWDLPIEAFRRALDGEAPAPAPPAAPEPRPTQPDADQYLAGTEHSRPQSAREVEREGHAYPGVYAGFRVAFRNTGEIVPDLFIIWRRGSRLFFRVFDPSFSHTGEVFILRHQLFLVGEDDQRVDGLICYILNGVSGQRAFRLDGVVMTVANDRHRTPGAAPIVLQRLMDLADSTEPPAFEALVAISERMKAAHDAGMVQTIAGPEIETAVIPMVGVPRPDGRIDHLVRRPLDRSLTASEVELTPSLAADLERVRVAFLDDAAVRPLGAAMTAHLTKVAP